MKSILTLVFILLCGVVALANTNDHSVELNIEIETYNQIEFSKVSNLLEVRLTEINEVKTGAEKEVARLYKFKNARIKKALNFNTKRNKAKRA